MNESTRIKSVKPASATSHLSMCRNIIHAPLNTFISNKLLLAYTVQVLAGVCQTLLGSLQPSTKYINSVNIKYSSDLLLCRQRENGRHGLKMHLVRISSE